ncbi:MAG: HAMP domain-containing sensor histidine kinase, partial [Balneolaceae bacterium]
SPISNLTNLAYLLEKIPIENNNLKEILDDSRTSIRVLNETIDDLTEILIIRDNPSVEQEKIAFSDIFENILQQTSYLIEKEKPRIVSNFEDAPSIFYNRVYLESIFLNLLTNALKFRSPSRRPEITITTIDRKDHVLLEFQDNGIGLDIRRYKDRIFGLYQRFHQHTDSKGLGLYLVKSQVEALGGSIEAKSKAGQGMTILIRFKKE